MTNPITSLTLTNFGPHQNLTLNLAPGLNLLRAPNRSGKTWVLRALAMLLFNEGPAYNKDDHLDEVRYQSPQGRKASYFSVQATFADGTNLLRYRDANRNAYTVTDPQGQTTEFNAIGSGFFEPIAAITGIRPLQLDGRSSYRPNLKLPTDPPYFLVGESEQKQDAILNHLMGLNVIALAEESVSKELRSAEAELKQAQQQQAELTPQVAILAQSQTVATRLKAVKPTLAQEAELRRQRQTGQELLARRSQLTTALLKAQNQATTLNRLPTASLGTASVLSERLRNGFRVLEARSRCKEGYDTALATAGLFQAVKALGNTLGGIDNFLAETVRPAGKLWAQLAVKQAQQQAAEQQQAELREQAIRAQAAYETALRELGYCPLCGQQICSECEEGIL